VRNAAAAHRNGAQAQAMPLALARPRRGAVARNGALLRCSLRRHRAPLRASVWCLPGPASAAWKR